MSAAGLRVVCLPSYQAAPPAVDVTSPGLVHQEPVEASRDCD